MKILLVLMVKNESKIIERCITSALSIVDGICICDTQSTDDTINVVKNIISTSNKPGKVYEYPFIDFGKSRTQSLENARLFATELGWDLKETFGLFLDADMILRIGPTFYKEFIGEFDHYKLLQKQGVDVYYNIRFIRLSETVLCVGKTHEAWKPIGENHKGAIIEGVDGIWIEDVADGGCKLDKFERDERLLLKGIEEEPAMRCRYYFYLAQTYYCKDDYEKAIEYYQKRIDEGGPFLEEIWFSHLVIAMCYKVLGIEKNIEKIKHHVITSYEMYGVRSENFLILTECYILLKDYENAWKYLNMGIAIPKPEKQLLYMKDHIYNEGFLFTKAHLAYLTNPEKMEDVLDIFYQLIEKNTSNLQIYVKGVRTACETFSWTNIPLTSTLSWNFHENTFPTVKMTMDYYTIFKNCLSYGVVVDDITYVLLYSALCDVYIVATTRSACTTYSRAFILCN